jgi:hypothetical protein
MVFLGLDRSFFSQSVFGDISQVLKRVFREAEFFIVGSYTVFGQVEDLKVM